MNWLRTPVTAMLMMSLFFSDIATFWHVGKCCSDHVQQATVADTDTTQTAQSNCGVNCRHDRNPFATRRAAARAEADRSAIAQTSCDDCSSQSSEEHDSEQCSLCRWLVTARDSVVYFTAAPHVELCPIQSSVIADWVSPTLPSLFQELSRRGPPAALCLS